MTEEATQKILYCSFCGKGKHEVKKLIAGPTVLICDECIELCSDIIRDGTSEVRHNLLGACMYATAYEQLGTLDGAPVHAKIASIDPERFATAQDLLGHIFDVFEELLEEHAPEPLSATEAAARLTSAPGTPLVPELPTTITQTERT